MTHPTRRGFLSLFALRRARAAPSRDPDAVALVLDDRRGQRLMATVAVWPERGYELREIVGQMAEDYGVCERHAARFH